MSTDREPDLSSRALIAAAPADWLGFLGRPTDPARVSVVSPDTAAVAAAADAVIRVDDPDPWLLHLEFQARHDADLPRRLLMYNGLLQHRHGRPVATVVVMLDRRYNIAELTGELASAPPAGPGWAFRYQVVRMWEQPVEAPLTGGLTLVPFAPLAAVPRADLPAVIRRMQERFDREAAPPFRRTLWAACSLLTGFTITEAEMESMILGIKGIEESSFYKLLVRKGLEEGRQAGLQEGRQAGMQEGRQEGRQEGAVEEARRLVVRLGTKRFGPPPPAVAATLDGIADPAVLEGLADRLLDVTGWAELIPTPTPEAT